MIGLRYMNMKYFDIVKKNCLTQKQIYLVTLLNIKSLYEYSVTADDAGLDNVFISEPEKMYRYIIKNDDRGVLNICIFYIPDLIEYGVI